MASINTTPTGRKGKKNIQARTIKNMGIGKEHMGAVAKFSPTQTIMIHEWILSTTAIVSSCLLLLVEVAMYVVDDHDHTIEAILSSITVFFTVLSIYMVVYKLARAHAAGTMSLADVLSVFVEVGMILVCVLEYLRVVVRMTRIKFRGFGIVTIVLAMAVFLLTLVEVRLRNKLIEDDDAPV